ncbi:hypothetical protein ClosIBUN13A_CONTIG254g04117 [Clostridium sp. IBUN13A]|nr:hypothetical protein ClosIBUN13A_CONTIG254g04117 [Clostridium sp. IBUN13A]
MERTHYMVDGLANENMKTQVKNALEKIDGVNNVCVNVLKIQVILFIKIKIKFLQLLREFYFFNYLLFYVNVLLTFNYFHIKSSVSRTIKFTEVNILPHS